MSGDWRELDIANPTEEHAMLREMLRVARRAPPGAAAAAIGAAGRAPAIAKDP